MANLRKLIVTVKPGLTDAEMYNICQAIESLRGVVSAVIPISEETAVAKAAREDERLQILTQLNTAIRNIFHIEHK